jgi:hypothetical protein
VVGARHEHREKVHLHLRGQTIPTLLALPLAALLVVSLVLRADTLPVFLPLVMAHGVAEEEQRIPGDPLPTHPRSVETGSHPHGVGTFDHGRADGPACCLVLRVVHLIMASPHR